MALPSTAIQTADGERGQVMKSTSFMPDGKPTPDVLTGEEAAEYLRLDGGDVKRTLARYRRMGLLFGFQIGREVRYRREDLQAFVDRVAEVNPH